MSHLVIHVYELVCDEPACEVVSDDYMPTGEPRALDWVRRQARGDGWAYRDGQDYCPDHAQGEARGSS